MHYDIHETDPLGGATALVLCCLALLAYFGVLGFGFMQLAVGLSTALRALGAGF